MKTGLILEGGAMRGMFTAGVTDVFMENNIKFDGAVGVSAGAAFGCNYKSNQIGRTIRYNTKYVQDKRYCGWGVFLKTGNIYSTDFCYNQIPLKYDVFDFDTYSKNPMEFYVVCTDVETGKAVYHKYEGKEDHGFDWVRASASMPLVSQIVNIDNRKLLDGGIADSIPLRFFESIGYDKNVIILTQPKDYVKKKNSVMPLIKLKYKKYPNFIAAAENRHNVYNETLNYISQKEKDGSVFVIRPKEALDIARIEKDPEKLFKAYNLGRETAKPLIGKLKDYLSE